MKKKIQYIQEYVVPSVNRAERAQLFCQSNCCRHFHFKSIKCDIPAQNVDRERVERWVNLYIVILVIFNKTQIHFFLRLEEERLMWVTPSENRIYKFNFPTSVTQVAVKSQSPDDICLTVSVQSPQVGPYQLLFSIFSSICFYLFDPWQQNKI